MSVVIPSYRSKKTIGLCLQALLNQSLRRDAYEIIVVDSSDDGTSEFIRENFPIVKLIHLPDRTLPGRGRNLGVKRSIGKYIVFMDTDCVAGEGLLQGMLEKMKNQNVAGVGGAVLNGTPGSPAGWVEYLINFNHFTPLGSPKFAKHIPTCNLCLRREILDQYGPFPTEFFPGEDRVFNWRLVHGGEQLLFDPALRVTHLNRTKFKQVFQHQFQYGKAFAITRSRYPLPGQFLVVFPFLSWMLPLARWGLILTKFHREPKLLGLTFFLSPMIWTALTFWAFGFWKKLQEIKMENKRKEISFRKFPL